MGLYEKYEKDIIAQLETKLNVAEYSHLLDLIKENLHAFNIKELRKLMTTELKDFNFSFLDHLFTKEFSTLSAYSDEFDSISTQDKERLMMEIMNNKKNKAVIKVSKPYNFVHVKEIIKELYEEYKTKTFIISKSHKIAGRVTYQKFESAKRISLIQEYQDLKKDSSHLNFVGDPVPKKAPIDENSHLFYLHEFETNDKEKIDLLTEKPIAPQECIIEGMVIPLNDDFKIGEKLTLGETKKLLIANEIILTQEDLDEVKIKDLCKGWNRESLSQLIFGKLRAPRPVETLKLAWLFSGKSGGYPLHLLVIGPNGTGKTMSYLTPMSIHVNSFGERKFIDGASTTLLGLVPSFSNTKAEPGLFIKSSRTCYIDEFFKTVHRSGFNLGGGNIKGLEPFTSLLEHKPALVASGNTAVAEFVATAKALFVTNPEKGLRELPQIIESLSVPAMARFLIYKQTQEEIDWIEEHVPEIMNLREEEYLPKRNIDVVNLFDFFYKREVVVDFHKIKGIRDRLKKEVPDALQDMFRTRYFHHIACLIDGVSNIRFLCNEKDSLEYDQVDYDEAETIIHYVVGGWNDNFNVEKVPVSKRHLFLHEAPSSLYELICKENGDLSEVDVEDKESLKKLLEYKLVYNKKGYLLPYYNPDIVSGNGVVIEI